MMSDLLDYSIAINESIHSVNTETGIINVPDKATKMEARAKRTNWTDTTDMLMWVVVDLSMDGSTWIENFVGFGTTGKDTYRKGGITVNKHSGASRNLPSGTNRRVRVKMILAKDVSINTKIEVGFD